MPSKSQITPILALWMSFSYAQTTWFVSNSGSNANTGRTEADPLATINHALARANCGDSLYILGGTYHEKIQAHAICPEDRRIVLQGDPEQHPIIVGDSTATNRYAVSANGAGYYFRHLIMTSPYPDECSQSNQVIVGLGDHFTFDNVVVFGSGYDGIKTYGDCSTNDFATNWKIINSRIFDCGLGCPASIVNGDGIDFTQCRDCLIENCTIKDNRGHQIQIKLDASNVSVISSHIEGIHMFQIGLPGAVAQCNPEQFNADGVYINGNTLIAKGDTSDFVFKLADVRGLSIQNNTVVKDSIDEINVGLICFGGCTGSAAWTNTPTTPVNITGNIFANYANRRFAFGPDTTFFDPFGIVPTQVRMDYNLFFDIHGQILSPIDRAANSLVADPLFCDYPVSFALQPNSPGIDAGDPDLPPDPDGTRSDIGARYVVGECSTTFTQDDLPSTELLQVFPNPFQHMLSFKAEHTGTLSIMDIYGRQISEYVVATKGQYEIFVSDLPDGIYVLVLKDSLGVIQGCSLAVK